MFATRCPTPNRFNRAWPSVARTDCGLFHRAWFPGGANSFAGRSFRPAFMGTVAECPREACHWGNGRRYVNAELWGELNKKATQRAGSNPAGPN